MLKIFKLTFLTLLISTPLYSENEYFQEGVNLFKNKKFTEAKFKFEQNIVFDPKSELSYLYLSKIFKNLEKKNYRSIT